jgi:hypothetical protein
MGCPDELTDDDFNDIDALDVDLMLADESRDALILRDDFHAEWRQSVRKVEADERRLELIDLMTSCAKVLL